MKAVKKLFAVILALTLIAALGITAYADGESYSITINNSNSGYTYNAYQIFTGTLNADGSLTGIEWGTGITAAGQTALYNKYNLTDTDQTAAKVAESIGENDAKDIAALLAQEANHTSILALNYTNGSYFASFDSAGYYLVLNESVPTGENEYYTTHSDYIVQVLGNVTIAPKSAKPTVDKQVKDEAADAESGSTDGWGETADHAMYEKYQYKLIATIPDDKDIESYETYKLVFHDTLSAGVSFAGNIIVTATNSNNTSIVYTTSNPAESEDNAPLSWTLTINDLKQYVTTLKGTVVTVTYDAYLNKYAAVGNSDANRNSVYLEYSNNPHAEGLGKTPTDTVYTFTYEMPNTKYGLSGNTETALENAGFKLYSDSSCTTEIGLIKDGTYYRPVKSGETAEEMKSGPDGKFDIRGLDVGIYYLKETTVPAGYNACENATIVISATHSENQSGGATTNFSMKMNGETSTNNKFVNRSGAVLPSTGGMGTTMIYAVGSVLVLVAGVLLISKKRMGRQ